MAGVVVGGSVGAGCELGVGVAAGAVPAVWPDDAGPCAPCRALFLFTDQTIAAATRIMTTITAMRTPVFGVFVCCVMESR
ncbi:MAG: hypothetical protein GIKADHBN_03318 [Phycisphaerales bacterium]|nr:hypothetical protein [Phycisphaerales bacterium]